jgi:hypothetical protein
MNDSQINALTTVQPIPSSLLWANIDEFVKKRFSTFYETIKYRLQNFSKRPIIQAFGTTWQAQQGRRDHGRKDRCL